MQSYKYQEEYQLALDGFSLAAQLDPSWENAETEERALLTFLDNVVTLTKNNVSEKDIQTDLLGSDFKA